jgi:seryl-tRNA synthetase
MLDINLIRRSPETIKDVIEKRNGDPSLVDKFLAIDADWRKIKAETDELRAKQKTFGEAEREKAKELKEQIQFREEKISIMEKERLYLLEHMPNLIAPDAPIGKSEEDNAVLREVGARPKFDFEPKDYLTLVRGLINTERAGRVAGSRFGYIFGDLVRMEFALIRLCFDIFLARGFIPVLPPVMVKAEIMKGMGKIKFIEDDDAFYLPADDLYLAGTSEHTIIPFHTEQTLDEADLPRRYVGFSTCFRREAGSYGKDMKGILRGHQFDKMELNSLVRPEDSEKEHLFLLSLQEELMQKLELPYRVMSISTGDMGFSDYKQYDIEAWMPSQGKYRETHSCSNTTDYQSRGLSIKYRKASGETDYLHTLNATGITFRAVIAIIENNQTSQGKIMVPKALRDYLGKDEIEVRDIR